MTSLFSRSAVAVLDRSSRVEPLRCSFEGPTTMRRAGGGPCGGPCGRTLPLGGEASPPDSR